MLFERRKSSVTEKLVEISPKTFQCVCRSQFFIRYTAIPYRASTGLEQGFPCVVFPHRAKPVFISWDPCNEIFFPCEKNYTGKTLFSLQGWVYSVLLSLIRMYVFVQICHQNHQPVSQNFGMYQNIRICIGERNMQLPQSIKWKNLANIDFRST